MVQGTQTSLVEAREAMTRHAWEEARDRFLAVDEAEPLAAPDLELLAEAGWWTGHLEERVDALERAYTAYLDEGDKSKAAIAALQIGEFMFQRRSLSVGGAWIGRAERLLETEPESSAHAWLFVFRAFSLLFTGDLDEGMRQAEHALELATKYGNRDVEALARNLVGRALLRKGEVAKGLAMIDESTVAAVGGELRAWTAGNVYCSTIDACRDLSDWQRAAEWTEQAERELRRQHIGGYPGVCRVHRAEIKRVRGDWAEAEEEAIQACVELERFGMVIGLGWGQYELGEIRLLMGDYTGAEEAFQRATQYGRDPQPGMALLRLAQGDQRAASSGIARALSVADRSTMLVGDMPTDPLGRAHLLPAQVEIALATGDHAVAEAAASELESIAGQFGSTAIHAAAAGARGAVLLAAGEAANAIDHLQRGVRLWQSIGAPYEVARLRSGLAMAYRAVGDADAARLELEAGRSAFDRLKAMPDLRRTDALLQSYVNTQPTRRGERQTSTFMFTDMVRSTDLIEIIGDQAWEELIDWHDATLRSCFARYAGEEISHAGDGFFVAFSDPRAAVDAAVAIQRTLALHRSEHGFAPWVRIGIHTAEATRTGATYRGMGVHAAARVGALAEKNEIVISADTLAVTGDIAYPHSELRSVTLKGIKDEVQVASVDWQSR